VLRAFLASLTVVLLAGALAAPASAQRFNPNAQRPSREFMQERQGGPGGPGGSPTFDYSAAAGIPLIDTHMHFEFGNGQRADLPGDAADAIAVMDKMNITTSFLMPPPEGHSEQVPYDLEAFAYVMTRYPGRFRLSGGAGSLGRTILTTPAGAVTDAVRQKFIARAHEIAAAGAVGFGEIGIEHFALPAMGPRHPFEEVPADHPLLLLLADQAAELGLPIDVHFDVIPEDMDLPAPLQSPPNPAHLTQNLPAFERFLAHNPKAKIVWAHVGGEPARNRSLELCRRLLQDHPNLYMSFRVQRGLPHPSYALAPDGTLKPMWRQLILQFPDRFVFGSDSFYTDDPRTRRGGDIEGVENFRRLLAQLPPDVAAKLANGNAAQIYRLGK